jgi:hypothetical protein
VRGAGRGTGELSDAAGQVQGLGRPGEEPRLGPLGQGDVVELRHQSGGHTPSLVMGVAAAATLCPQAG